MTTNNIGTVKLQGTGYLLNGTMHVPMAPGNSDYSAILQWIAEGNTPEPEFTDEEIEAKALEATAAAFKTAKLNALANLTVTIGENTYDGNETARTNMLSAISRYTRSGIEEHEWKMANNDEVLITIEELQDAHDAAIVKVGQIVFASELSELPN